MWRGDQCVRRGQMCEEGQVGEKRAGVWGGGRCVRRRQMCEEGAGV